MRYMYICIYVCMYIYICIYLNMYRYIWNIYIHIYVYIYMCIYQHVFLSTYMCIPHFLHALHRNSIPKVMQDSSSKICFKKISLIFDLRASKQQSCNSRDTIYFYTDKDPLSKSHCLVFSSFLGGETPIASFVTQETVQYHCKPTYDGGLACN